MACHRPGCAFERKLEWPSQRTEGTIVYELLEPMPGFGLAKLYESCAGDIFFDIEGDPFVGDSVSLAGKRLLMPWRASILSM
jgi:hypothetical protein